MSSEQELASAIASASTNEEREALLADDRELVTAELVQRLLDEGNRRSREGDYEGELKTFRLTADVAQRAGDKIGAATALRAVGGLMDLRGQYAHALEYFQKSLTVSEESGDKDGTANTLNFIGLHYRSQGDYAQAMEHFQKSLRLSEEVGNRGGVARALANTGIIYSLLGNYIRAIEYYQQSLKIKEEIHDKGGTGATLNSIGVVYERQGNYAQALDYYEKSLKIGEAIGYKLGISANLNNIGNVYNSQGRYAEALEQFQKSLRISEEIKDYEGIGDTLNNIGSLYHSQGDYDHALGHFHKALKIAEGVGDEDSIASTLCNISRSYNSQGNYTQAMPLAIRAASIAEQIGSPGLLWQASLTAGEAHLALHRPGEARQAFEQAVRSVEELRSQVAGSAEDSQRSFESQLVPYHQMLQLLVDQNNPVEAFAYAERTKARALLDTLQADSVAITKTMTPDEKEVEQKLRSEIRSLNTQVAREKLRAQTDSSRPSELSALLERARLDYEAFNLNLYVAHPELRTYRGQTQPVSLDQCAELVKDGATALLEYVVAEDKVFLFILARREKLGGNAYSSIQAPALNVYTLKVTPKDLAEKAERFRNLLAGTNIGFRNLAAELYESLLKPAADQLRGKSSLVIVPDGPLWDLPFQALQSDHRRYLVEDYSISYVHSLTALREMIRRRNAVPRIGAATLFAMGNPSLGKTTLSRIKQVFMDEHFDPLPWAEKQVQELGKLYGQGESKIYRGAEASEKRFKAEAQSYRILHLATHGILNNRNPMYSYLLLSQIDGSEREDGLLEAWELMKLNLKADMAVLSACETARGRAASGEGMIGLSWALFVAGVPTTVASQWKVDDSSTAQLMVEFHRRLRSRAGPKVSKAEALRRASLKLLRGKRYRHPFYWAGFVLVGDGF